MQYNKYDRPFDEINHDVIIDKLLKSSEPTMIVRTVRYKLKNRFADVRFYNEKREE